MSVTVAAVAIAVIRVARTAWVDLVAKLAKPMVARQTKPNEKPTAHEQNGGTHHHSNKCHRFHTPVLCVLQTGSGYRRIEAQ